jgi:ATP-dependent Lhr-like helicase
VILVDGEPAVFVERGGKRLITIPAATRTDVWADALVSLVKEGRVGRLVVQQIDGEPAATSPLAGVLRSVGFAEGYRGLTLSSR